MNDKFHEKLKDFIKIIKKDIFGVILLTLPKGSSGAGTGTSGSDGTGAESGAGVGPRGGAGGGGIVGEDCRFLLGWIFLGMGCDDMSSPEDRSVGSEGV